MAIFANGKNLWMYKGDTGQVAFSGLPTDKLYNVYMSIYDENTNTIKDEIQGVFNQSDGVVLVTMDKTTSDKLVVGEFTYALKGCYDGSEDTWIPETKLVNNEYVQEAAPTFTVLYKHVEGDA